MGRNYGTSRVDVATGEEPRILHVLLRDLILGLSSPSPVSSCRSEVVDLDEVCHEFALHCFGMVSCDRNRDGA